MGRITANISQIGGKYRLLKEVLKRIPYHEFYLETFLGSAIVLLNKPRCRYECGNDLNGEIINYLLTIRKYPKEFDTIKQGVFGLVSQEICNRIVRGELIPKNDIERAYFFYYLNKLTFAGAPTNIKGFGGIIDQKRQNARIDAPGIEKAKAQYSGMLNNFALGTIKEKQCEEAKASYHGVVPPYTAGNRELGKVKKQYQQVKEKAQYRGIAPKNSNYKGVGGKYKGSQKDVAEPQRQYNAQIKGINPKTTRPYTNNDCGLLSPLNPEAIKRLRYVNLTAYPFDKVYTMFYKAFHERKGLGEECFCYFDPPYPDTEKYYGTGFGVPEHEMLVEFLIESPFHCLLSIGGGCTELYNEPLKDAGFTIEEVAVKYSTSANHQSDKKEYLISNYNIKDLPLMILPSAQQVISNEEIEIPMNSDYKVVNAVKKTAQRSLF